MISRTVMPNGVRVITDIMPQVRSATIGFWLACGSRHDAMETAGTAHFIEHMFFKGTKKRTARQLALEVDYIGGQMNAFTSAEYTCYYMKVLDTHLQEAFELLADMFLNSLFATLDINKEQQIILQEYDMYEDNPDDFLQDKFFSYIWGEHPLGRNILGSKKTIRKIKKQALETFLHDFYKPDNLVVAVAGNVLHEDVCGLVDKYFRNLTGKAKILTKQPPVFQTGNKNLYKDTAQTQIIWGLPCISIKNDNLYAFNVFNNIFGASVSSHLFQHIREEKGLAYFIYSSLSCYTDTGVFSINVGVKPENSRKTLALIDEQIALLLTEGVKSAELKKAKEQINSSLIMSYENSSERMQRIGKMSVLDCPVIPAEIVIDMIKKISLADIENIIHLFIKDKTPAVVRLGPKSIKELR